MSESNVLLIEPHEHVLLVTLNRPSRRNALDHALMNALRGLWSDAERLRDVRCVVLTGSGPGFCAGADMSLLADDRADAPSDVHVELSFLPGLQIACPVVVAVNGVCAGGGLHFVADGDIVLASSEATFLDPHVSVGQVSALEPLGLWPRVSSQTIARMALLGSAERLDAGSALRAGLVSEVVEPGGLVARALELAESISRNSPAAVAATRRVLRRAEGALLGDALQEGWDAIRAHWSHPDSKEGPAAFAAKRPPEWTEG